MRKSPEEVQKRREDHESLIRGGLIAWKSKRPKYWLLQHRRILVENAPHCRAFWAMVGR